VLLLIQWGVPQIHVICVIASRSGLKNIMEAYPDIYISVGTVDEEVTEEGFVIPGLGDVGDRLFGTATVLEDDESLMHPSRRKRALSALRQE
jgi:uracil phosphoribosyltransferase